MSTPEEEIEKHRKETEESVKNIMVMLESMLRDEKNAARLLELMGEIPLTVGNINDNKRDA
jgi:hypothetical protein